MKKKCAILCAGLILLFFGSVFYINISNKAFGGESEKKEDSATTTEKPLTDSNQLQQNSTATAPNSAEMASSPFEIPLELQQRIGVKTVKVSEGPLTRTIRTVGRVEIDQRKLTTINIKFEGWVEKLYADYEGKYVQKGEPLAKIWSPEALAIQLEYINLLNWLHSQVPRYQRVIEFEWGDRYGTNGKLITYDPEPLVTVAKQKFKLWGFTEAEIKKVEDSLKPFETITISSPSNGFVYRKPAFEGTRVDPGEKLFDIVDLSTVWILADLYEYELPLVAIGQPAHISLSYFPEMNLKSHVDFIYPTLSGQTRTVKARFIVENPNLILKPDMFADVEMKIDLGNRLAVPREAVLDTGLRQVAYVDIGDGYFEMRQVKIGVKADAMVEIKSGLKEGEVVAVSPVFLIDSEAKLKGVVR